jgi:exonuclease III
MVVMKVINANICSFAGDGMRRLIMSSLKKEGAEICCLMESKAMEKDYNKIRAAWGQYLDQTSVYMDTHEGTTRKKGCIILFKPGLNIKLKKILKSGDGSHIVIAADIQGILHILACFYGEASSSDTLSLNTLQALIHDIHITQNVHQGGILLAGDFNFVTNDIDTTTSVSKPRMRDAMLQFINQQQLLDLWTETNPQDEGFTRVTATTRSRIDHIYIQDNISESPTMTIEPNLK